MTSHISHHKCVLGLQSQLSDVYCRRHSDEKLHSSYIVCHHLKGTQMGTVVSWVSRRETKSSSVVGKLDAHRDVNRQGPAYVGIL